MFWTPVLAFARLVASTVAMRRGRMRGAAVALVLAAMVQAPNFYVMFLHQR